MTEPTPDNQIPAIDAEAPGEVSTADKGSEKAQEKRYLEYKGDPKYGTEFLHSHTITPAQAKAAEWEVLPEKDMVWTRRESGRNKGRMLLDLADLPAGIEEELTTDPAFRVVTLSS